MGYTHHWRIDQDVDPVDFARAVSDCKALASASGVALAAGLGTGQPVFKDDHLELNGEAPGNCEPLILRLEEGPRPCRFCKTNWLPYDLVVTACLIAFAHHIPGFQPSSDGGSDDWGAARELCQQVLGYGADFRLNE